MDEKQKTIQSEVTLEGVGLHTGHKTKVCLKPAEVGAGICFIRTDLPGSPKVKADFSSVDLAAKVSRCTSIGAGEETIYTIEHLMSVLCGLGIDNLTIEINGNEVPGMDGSATFFLNAVKKSGVVEQAVSRKYCEIKEPLWVERNGCSLLAIPASDFKISYTLDYSDFRVPPQFFSLDVNQQTFEQEIAPCRTFCMEKEVEQLKALGLGKGANYENTLVVGEKGVVNNKLRFENEFARHKVLDLIGDLYLLGQPIKGHIFAVKSGHTLNLQLLKKIFDQSKKTQESAPDHHFPSELVNATQFNIDGIMKILPHRYPFLLVDRVLQVEPGKRAVAVKNVTFNENFFQGHFPARPIMPGVLMVEAMAQVGGIAVLTDKQNHGKLAFFLSADKVKFRKIVSPGDQLVMEVDVIRNKAKFAQVRGVGKVNGEIVVEADLVFSFTDGTYLG